MVLRSIVYKKQVEKKVKDYSVDIIKIEGEEVRYLWVVLQKNSQLLYKFGMV